MKILITTDWYRPVINGVVTSVLNLTEQLEKRGHEVKVLTLSRNCHSYKEENVIYAGSVGMGKIYPQARVKIPVVAGEYMEELLAWKPDLIHSQCEFSTFFLAKRIAGELDIPIIHTYHTVYEDYTHYFSPQKAWGRSLVQMMTRKLSVQVDAMIAPSEKIEHILNGYQVSCPVDVVPSGIDTEKYRRRIDDGSREALRERYGIKEDEIVFVYVGRMAKEKNITTMAIVNVVGSSIAREADKVFYTLAGPEISVATTKAYSAQLAAMYCLAVQFAKVRGKISEEQYSYYISEMLTIPDKMQKVLEDKERIQWFASKYANAHDVFFVGRGIDYAVCLEGSLKLKEISYIHSEAYAAGELKHGTISLIEQGTLVIGVLTQSELYEKTISNMLECKSRGAYLMGLTTYGKYEIEDQVNFTVYVPKVDEHFVGSLAVVPLQLIGYYVSVAKGLDVDKPRNLAKSVTVE